MAQAPSTPTGSRRNLPRGIVLCPLRYEQKQLCAAGIGESVDVDCCGPGRECVKRWFDRHESRVCQAPWVLLVGLAGAIDPSIMPGTAHVASEVVTSTGDDRWRSSIAPQDERDAVVVATSDELIATRAAREELFRTTGAQVVDQESAYFASLAEQQGARWGIVRGISDGMETILPRGVARWVEESGQTRFGRMMWDLLRSPGDLPRLISLGRTSSRAMREAARLLHRLIEHDAKAQTSS